MKKSQKGFTLPFLVVIVAILIIGVISYAYLKNKNSESKPNDQKISENINSSTTPSDFNNEIIISTTTSTKVPVTINIFMCDDQGTCFGSAAVKGETIKG